MAIKNYAQLYSAITTNIIDNNSEYISAQIVRDLLIDMNDSYFNQISNTTNIRFSEWSTGTTYSSGNGVIYNGQLYQSIASGTTTQSSFTPSEWSQINIGTGLTATEYVKKINAYELLDNKKLLTAATDASLSTLVPGFYNVVQSASSVGLNQEYPVAGVGVLFNMSGSSSSNSLQLFFPQPVTTKIYSRNLNGSNWNEIKTTDTTYTAGSGLELNSTEFSLGGDFAVVNLNGSGATPNFNITNLNEFNLDGVEATLDFTTVNINGLVPSLSASTICSGSTNLYDIFATLGASGPTGTTFVQSGTNTFTGGTESLPTVNITSATLANLSTSGTNTANSFFATTLSGGTIYSGGTNLYDIFYSKNSLGTERNLLRSLSSGLISGGTLSVNALDNTKFDISAGKGSIVDNWTDVNNPVIYEFNWNTTTGITTTNLTSSTTSYISIDKNGSVIQKGSIETNEQRRDLVIIGQLGHANKISIASVNSKVSIFSSPVEQLRDLSAQFSLINSGNRVYANGANLNINKTNGELYGYGINYQSNPKNPSLKNIPEQLVASFRYRTQTGGTTSTVTLIDPTKYDLNGVITSIPGGINVSTNQRVYLFPNGNLIVQYGQQIYSSLSEAIQSLDFETFNAFQNVLEGAILIGIISIAKSCTDLTNSATVKFLNASKLGETVGSAAGISTSSLQQAYNNSIEPEIVTNSTLSAISIKNGTGNANNITRLIEGVNSSNVVTSYILADGGISGTSISGGTIYSGSTNLYSIFLTQGSVASSPYSGNGILQSIKPVSGTNTNSGVWSAVINGTGNTSSGSFSVAEGRQTTASGNFAHSEGYKTTTSGVYSHSEGRATTASNTASHSEGAFTNASGAYSHAEGRVSIASGYASHSEGSSTASGNFSHAEGGATKAIGNQSHSEGLQTTSSGSYSHSEGLLTTSSSRASHSEGSGTTASAYASHAEGQSTIASNTASHAGGQRSSVSSIAGFVHALNSSVAGDYSSILGGSGNTISVSITGSTILGGSNIVGSTNNTTYVPAFVITNPNPIPTVSGSTGTKGTVSYDNNYLYICYSTNNWGRIVLDKLF